MAVQVDDVVTSNSILYSQGEHPDHVVVIKYVPYVADSKRAMDEYTSEVQAISPFLSPLPLPFTVRPTLICQGQVACTKGCRHISS